MSLSLGILRKNSGLDSNRRFRPLTMASQWIQIAALEKTILQHLTQPPETLCPDQRNILVGQACLAAGIFLFRLDAGGGNVVEFRQKSDAVAFLFKPLQACAIFGGNLTFTAIMCVEKQVSEEKRPLAFDVLENLQLARLVVESIGVFKDGLMSIAKEAFATVAALQTFDDF